MTIGLNYFKNLRLDPRPQQVQALQFLTDNWDKYDYFVLQLPTGVGKTHFALAATERFNSSWIATSTLQLMDQYLKSNHHVVDIRGRRNYTCVMSDTITCEYGPCKGDAALARNCKMNNLCPYENQKAEASRARWAVTNYSYLIYCTHCGFLSDSAGHGKWPMRDVAIFDEAHNLDSHLISFASRTYEFDAMSLFKQVKKHYNASDDIVKNADILDEVKDYLIDATESLEAQIKDLYAQCKIPVGKRSKYNSKEFADAQRLAKKKDILDKYLQPLRFWSETRNHDPRQDRRWIIHGDVFKNTIQLVPLKADFVFNHYFNNNIAKKFIFMSATIGDFNVFCEKNGIPKDKACFFETDTPFDASRSPVFAFAGKDSVNTAYGKLDAEFPKICSIVEKIMDAHAKEGGIIHTGNYKVAKAIWAGIGSKYKDRLLFKEMREYADLNNEELLKLHEEAIAKGFPSVLLSPSLMEGVDLKDDLSRWQLVVKLPFASLGDIRIKTIVETTHNWYVNDMLVKLVQACGRSTRSENDSSRTYIIDSLFPQIYMKNYLPEWFRKRITIIRD